MYSQGIKRNYKGINSIRCYQQVLLASQKSESLFLKSMWLFCQILTVRIPTFGLKDNSTVYFKNVHTYYPVVTVVTAEKVDDKKPSFQSYASFI